MDFAPVLSRPAAPSATVTVAPATTIVQAPAPVVTQQVVVGPSEASGFLMRPDEQWGWNDLRDYVIGEIEKRHGPQLRDPKKEAGIFKGFISRWPTQAVAIAKAAFGPAHDGMWRSAPISINRFTKNSDPYFAAPLAERL